MSEAQRFLRYVLPGLSTILVLLLTFLVSDFDATYSFLTGVGEENGLGISLLTFLGSGALGYLLANVYFALIWQRRIPGLATFDHTRVINHLVETERLKIVGYSDEAIEVSEHRQAWEIINSFYCYEEVARLSKTYMSLVGNLCNITHALGATIIGIALVIPLWCSLYFGTPARNLQDDWMMGAIVLASIFLLIYLLSRSYRQALLSAERIANSVFKAYVMKNSKVKQPVRLVFLE